MKEFVILLTLAAAAFAGDSSITGRWTGYTGGILHTWQFQDDGSFQHVWVTPGAGASLLRQERGSYRVEPDTIELSVAAAITGVAGPDRDGHKSLMGGARTKSGEIRRVKLKVVEPGKTILVDGIKLASSAS